MCLYHWAKLPFWNLRFGVQEAANSRELWLRRRLSRQGQQGNRALCKQIHRNCRLLSLPHDNKVRTGGVQSSFKKNTDPAGEDKWCVCFFCIPVPLLLHQIIIFIDISYHIISYHIISYHIISYHIISYHIISYHIISYHMYINIHKITVPKKTFKQKHACFQ